MLPQLRPNQLVSILFGRDFYVNSLKMLNSMKRNSKMSLKFDLTYNNCSWIFNSTQKRIVRNIRFKCNCLANHYFADKITENSLTTTEQH